MFTKFTEKDTETYYDNEDAIYRAFWDQEGSVHWGVFDQGTGKDFLKACANLNQIMIQGGKINRDAKVLDLGCGNGTTAIWLSEAQGCHVTGVDLSGVRIGNAKTALTRRPFGLQSRLAFEKASATELPFEDGTFTHVWSQAVIYHVHDKEGALSEAYRVLRDGGIMVFDDLIKPKKNISPNAQQYVYDRLLFDTAFSFTSYQIALEAQGFKILEAHNFSEHLKTSYLCLSERVPASEGEHSQHFRDLSAAYIQTAKAVENDELGWGYFVCQK
jgi:ubiquinone/menaquinone biosynthesis C-methylase UbiE|tara:strand:+ start:192 stop:1010 length:819 start_codon:yes stop_codon:yes gene_type:complete